MFLDYLLRALQRDAAVPAVVRVDHHIGPLLAEIHATGAVHPRLGLQAVLLHERLELLQDLLAAPAGAAALAWLTLVRADVDVFEIRRLLSFH